METLFDYLTRDEQDVLYFAPAWIALLIAGADDHIDSKELKVAEAFIDDKKDQDDEELRIFYTKVVKDFQTNLKGYKELLPEETQKRNLLLVEQLERLNVILPQIDGAFARQYYRDMKALALKVAEASGGILALNPVSEKEKEFLNLSMINEPG
jgi:hypothetical protein